MRRKTKSQINKNVKFIRSSEFEATYYFSRTNRKSSYIDRSLKK